MIERLQSDTITCNASDYARELNGRLSNGPDATGARVRQVDDNQAIAGNQQLSEKELQQVQDLKQRDREVRAHERAHMAAGAGLVQGGASFTFQRGPDGGMYAVGGEVKIDTSADRDPDQTIRKMQQVKRAALAPAEPSGTDRSVAALAGKIEAQARQEKNDLEQAEMAGRGEDGQPFGAQSVRRPYSDDAVGRALNIAV